MKKIAIIIIAAIAILGIWLATSYNGMMTKSEEVSKAWSNVENQYQRRSDLIPNLVNTVKGYAAHEQSTLQGVVEARGKATQMKIDGNNLTPEAMAAYQKAQGEIGAALSRLIAIKESYPDLKANQNFIELQAQLEGTENRISVERNRFNEVAREYNVSVKRFPNVLIAGMFGFEARPYFEATEEAEKAPEVKF